MVERLTDACNGLKRRQSDLANRLLPGLGAVPGLEASRLRALRERLQSLETECAGLAENLSEAKRVARKEGYMDGYSEARADALGVLSEAARLRQEILYNSRDEIVEVGFRLAEKAMGEVVERTPERVGRLLAEFVSLAGRDGEVTAYMNPSDLEKLSIRGLRPDVRTVPEQGVAPGELKVRVGKSIFDCGQSARFSRLKDEVRTGEG